MLEVRNLRAITFDLDRIDLHWEVGSESEDPQDYDFYVLRSGSPLGPFDTLAGPLVDRYFFRDVQVVQQHRWNHYYYKIKLIHRQSGEEKLFPDIAVGIDARPPLDALAIRREEFVLFREHVGRTCWVFKKRRFGLRCPNCYVKHSKRQTRSECFTCFGTTYARGYHYPIETLVQFDPSVRSEQHMTVAKTEQDNTTARGLWFPAFDPGDVVVEANNTRWRVLSATNTERLRAVVHQELQFHAVVKGDIEYSVPLELEESTLQASPPREFLNPHNPGEIEEDLRDILDVYRA